MSHLRKPAVECFASEIALGFLDDSIEIELLLGRSWPPMKFKVAEFVPTNNELSRFPVMIPGGADQPPSFTQCYPLPTALRDAHPEGLLEKCRKHTQIATRYHGYVSHLMPKRMSSISKEVLQAIARYHASIQAPALASVSPQASVPSVAKGVLDVAFR